MHQIPTRHQVRTWFELVRLIKGKLAKKSATTFLYGDLAESIFGARNRGAQSFANPLGEIHFRTKAYNRRMHSHHPSLNTLVFNEKGDQPGIPERQDPKHVWRIIESQGPRYLDRLSVLLGYQDFKNEPSPKRKYHPSADGTGPTGGGTRSSAIWEGRHSPLVKEISEILRNEIKCIPCDGSPWSPDIVLTFPTTRRTLLVEVKPDSTSHNIITAIGQIICYRSKFTNVTSIIAAPGTSHIGAHMKKVIDTYKIDTLDLDLNLRKQIMALYRNN
jgi:hypothetical protein